jgi:anti-sigma B factor antagonist
MPDAAIPKILTFEIERNGESAIVRCHGRLVSSVADELYQAVKPLLPETKTVIIDLADLTYVDSMGLGTLVRLYVSSRDAGCRFAVEHLGKQVRNILSMTNLLSVFAQAEDDNITIA